MRPVRACTLLLACAFTALAAGCDRPEPENAAANQAGPAAAASPASIQASHLVGRWSESPECASGFEFRADGSFTVTEGGEGRWTLAGNVLTLTGGNGSARVTLRELSDRAMVALDEQGRTSHSVRC